MVLFLGIVLAVALMSSGVVFSDLMADAALLKTDPDDFSRADSELSYLQWIPLDEARNFKLPHITNVVLDDVAAAIGHDGPPENVRFFYNAPGVKEYRSIA